MADHSQNIDPIGKVELGPGVLIARTALRYRFSRSSGPGGQNVNKLNTKATLVVSLGRLKEVLDAGSFGRLERLARRHIAAGQLCISSDTSRSQLVNRGASLTKLRRLVVRARIRPKARKPTRPTASSVQRRLAEKVRRGRIKRSRQQKPQADDQ